MAKQNAKAAEKVPKAKKAAVAPAKQPAPVDGADPRPEGLESVAPASGDLPPAAANEAAVHPEVPEEEPEAGAAPEGDSLPEPQSAPEGRQAEVCSPKGLNLRAGPALSYEALAVLPDGMEVTALALPRGVTVPGWELVVAGERAGWASSRFLRPLEG